MPENWKSYKLGDISEIIMGQSPKGATTNNLGEGIALLNGPTEFGYSYPTPTQFTIYPKKISKKGDLLFCVRGSTTGKMNFSDQPYAIGRGIGAFRGKNGFSTKYIKYLIDLYLDRMLAMCTGSTFPNLSRSDLENFPVNSCSPKESDKIASILSALDDKIELNIQMNKTLEEMAMALYKHWFVDFGPFQDGEFVDSEIGEIPKGWEIKKLEDILKYKKGKKPTKVLPNQIEGYLPQILISSFDEIHSGFASITNMIISNELDILMVMDGSGSGRTEIGFPGIVGSTIARLDINRQFEELRLPIYFLLRSNQQLIKDNTTGTSIPHTDKSFVGKFTICTPGKEILNSFNGKATSLLNLIKSNLKENGNLKQTRDTLLPKLISGEVGVKDVEKTLTEVL